MGKKKKDKEIRDVLAVLDKEHIKEANIADISEEWLKIFGGNISVARISPHFIDGLKPVARRMLYALHINPNKGKNFRKVARVSADTIAFHPHGDVSVSDVVYNLGAEWTQNLMLLDPYGNFGNIRGDDPAHPRYTETRLSAAAQWILFSDMKDSNVPMYPSYDGDSMEPEYLPARIPLVLCNPQFSGIGVGVATNIPPFNPVEVVKATIKLIKNKDANIMLIPDSPTGCDVVDTGQFKLINDIGDDAKLTMRATYEIDYISNIITITTLPLQINVDQVIKQVIAIRESGKLSELIDIQDSTAESTVNLKFILKSDANPDEFVEKIMGKKSGLKKTYPVEIRVIDDYRSKVWGVKKLLLEWIDYRRDCVRAIYNKKLMDALSEQHMNEIFLFVFNGDNLKKTIGIAHGAKNKSDMETKFMKEYKITSLQAKTLSEMRTYQYSKEAYEGYKQKKVELDAKVKEYTAVVEDDEAVDAVIISQLEEFIKLFGEPRRSNVIKLRNDGKLEEKIPNTMHLVGISRDGYIKKLNLSQHYSIGIVGKTSQVLVTRIFNRDNLLIFDSTGRISRVPVSSIPDMDYEDNGVELVRYFKLNGEPVSIINEMDMESGMSDIVFVTENGSGKKVKMEEFSKIKDFKEAIQLVEGDRLVSAIPAGVENFIIYTNFGDGILLNTADIKRQSKTARGLQLISLKANEKVVGIDFVVDNCDKILYITSAGRMKKTESKYLPVMNRKDEPVSLISLEGGEYVVGIAYVKDDDKCVVYKKKSKPITIEMKDVPLTSRVAKAEKLVKTPNGDIITGFCIIRK